MKTPRTSLAEIRCIAADCGVTVTVSPDLLKIKFILLHGDAQKVDDAIGLLDGWEVYKSFEFCESKRKSVSIQPIK